VLRLRGGMMIKVGLLCMSSWWGHVADAWMCMGSQLSRL
jgi:hypothetical protein